jgi:hypothetical protein
MCGRFAGRFYSRAPVRAIRLVDAGWTSWLVALICRQGRLIIERRDRPIWLRLASRGSSPARPLARAAPGEGGRLSAAAGGATSTVRRSAAVTRRGYRNRHATLLRVWAAELSFAATRLFRRTVGGVCMCPTAAALSSAPEHPCRRSLGTAGQRGQPPARDAGADLEPEAAVLLRRVEPKAAGVSSGRFVAALGRPFRKPRALRIGDRRVPH